MPCLFYNALCTAEARGYERGVRECVEKIESNIRQARSHPLYVFAGMEALASALVEQVKELLSLLPTQTKGTGE
jgi:hypothetical protein